MIGTRQMFYARLPEVKGSAGSVAFALDEVLRASPAYRWTLNHTLRCDDPLELFPTHVVDGRQLKPWPKLATLAKTIRSKNAGVDLITFDVIFTDKRTYERVKPARVLTRESVCALYRIRAVERSPTSSSSIRPTRSSSRSTAASERQPRRSRHLRRAAIRAAPRHRGAGE